MVKLGNLEKVVLYVKDIGAVAGFYREKLGLRLRIPEDPKEIDGSFWVEFDTGPATLAMHAGGEGRKGEDSPTFSFRVEDVRATRGELVEKGVRMGEARDLAPGIVICHGYDPEDNIFYISQGS
jgi:predicted enzyme related to lactoylglutathione lyase